ncbi:hypothetical protein L249_1685 [Ophiocordyceps polyrhachis-furcata BCC 54312]|uniref:Xylanolytic transcriptional activator regulatory domain-containing protein n=1 Tax=Ophiocordyceps polyrhachis-furcata BCC 54312 TaxID=1330021 RepID=A0A367LQ13_9HYPO|nr:hypothetical protein L249_1685 [Ophiocordyceps polyrhachis-furcata BCC 54312]
MDKGKPLDSDSGSQTTTNTPTATNNTPQSQMSASHAGNATSSSKRRRGPGVVTANACTECRKKRAKCIYEVPVRQSKENLRHEIETLRQRQRSSDVIFEALQRMDLGEEVLQRLRDGQSVETISESINETMESCDGVADREVITKPRRVDDAKSLPVTHAEPWKHSTWHTSSSRSQAGSTRSSSLPEALGWPQESSVAQSSCRMEGLLPDQVLNVMPRSRGLELILDPSCTLPADASSSNGALWTNVTGDANLVQHLLALYFCWEYPTFASLSKEHFLRDFRAGRSRYCSDMLVNALLALGCRFSTHPKSRANPADPNSSGDHFFEESQRLLNREIDQHSLTTIQALGIMSIREASCGRDSESWYYAGQSIRLAIEMGLHLSHEDGDEHAVQSATFWGAFALDSAWSLATGSLPQCSRFPCLPPKPTIIGDIEASLWVPYTDDGAPLQRSYEQPSNVRSVYKCFCELSELVHRSLYLLHSPGKPLAARDLLSIYTQFLSWYDQVPEVLRLGHNFTPAVLFAHMYYHFAILLLFRPLIKLRFIGSNVLPRDVCSQAADAIQGLLTSYSQLYTLQRTPSFVPYFVLTSAIMHLAIGSCNDDVENDDAAIRDPHISEILDQGIKDLVQMAPCHRFAEQALHILRYLAKKWRIDVEMGEKKDMSTEHYDGLVRTHTNSLNFFSPNLDMGDFVCGWARTEAKLQEKSYFDGAHSMPQAQSAPRRPTAGRLLSLPQRWLALYDDFISKNAGQVSQIESALRSLTYIIPGRFRDAEIASESIHSAVQLLSIYHDHLLSRTRGSVTGRSSPPPSAHARYTRFWAQRSALYRRVAVVLQTVIYSQLLCEMAAKRRGGEKARWRVVVLLESIKTVCRLLLLRAARGRPLLTPALPEREHTADEDETTMNSRKGSELRSESGFPDDGVMEPLARNTTRPSPAYDREWVMPRTGLSLPSLPDSSDISSYLLGRVLTADDIKPATKLLNRLHGTGQVAEVLHILAPLIYAVALARSANPREAWKPWLLGLAVELAARQLRDRSLRSTTLERDEWNRRGWAMTWWAMRGAFYANSSSRVIARVSRSMPSIVGGILDDYGYLWQTYYFCTSA